MSTKTIRIVYWVSTLLFVAALVWSAIQYLIEAPRMIETMTHLGYPLYFTKILGIAKLFGAVALLYPGFRTLKEWAYAGFTFDVVGAFLSHVSVGDPILIALVPLAFLMLLLTSYLTWKRLLDRTARSVARDEPRRWESAPINA